MSLATTSIEDFVKLIEINFKEYCGKCSRLDPAWGVWSTVMNREIRKRLDGMNKHNPEYGRLVLLFNYWTIVSQLLELNWKYKGKFFGANKIKKKVREAKQVREFVLE